MTNFKRIFLSLLLIVVSLSTLGGNGFVTRRGGQLWRDGKPYYFVGTNFWYGAILGSTGQGGDRELDFLKEQGVDSLRILVGSDGERGVTTKVEPTLQIAPGVYNDTILDGLDYLLMQIQRREMVAGLYLNSWEWRRGRRANLCDSCHTTIEQLSHNNRTIDTL